MEKTKCITFDKAAQDALPEHIKDKMKADRAKAREERTLNRLKNGERFTGTHFAGNVTPIEIKGEVLAVKCESRTGFVWYEDWNLQHTLWGFESGEYSFINA